MAMDSTRYTPSTTARRFEMGTPPVPNCYAAEAGLAILAELGLPAIESRVAELTTSTIEQAKSAGYSLSVPEDSARRGPMVTLQTQDEYKLVGELENAGVITSSRNGNLRISPHFYNNHDDIDALFSALRPLKHLMV